MLGRLEVTQYLTRYLIQKLRLLNCLIIGFSKFLDLHQHRVLIWRIIMNRWTSVRLQIGLKYLTLIAFVHSFIQAISIAPFKFASTQRFSRYSTDIYCVGVSSRSATGNCK